MTQYKRDKFEAAAFFTSAYNVKDLINLAQNLDCYIYHEVTSHDTLGQLIYENLEAKYPIGELLPYLDFEAMGIVHEREHKGEFVGEGYIYRNDKTKEHEFDPKNTPDAYKVLPPAKPELEHNR